MEDEGWLGMDCISSLDGVNNPRPEIVECLSNLKQGIAHYVRGRESICGKATFLTGRYDYSLNQSLYRSNTEDILKSPGGGSAYEPCKECLSKLG